MSTRDGCLQTVNPAGQRIIGPWTVGQPLLDMLRLSEEAAAEFPGRGEMCRHLMTGAVPARRQRHHRASR
ncbi:MAG: hypothetical protein V9E98_00370 [Candidatus Nanopelagicales bacterium]